jgi:predicted RNA binding protein YcfA (HicA-like mRNA interferase family)
MKKRDLEKHLRAHGCELKRHGSRHDFWHKVGTDRTSAVPRHKKIDPHTTKGILEDLDVPKPTSLN